jgi:hypothetical protein
MTFFLPNILVEFAMAIKAVPMSANTASHMVASPMAPSAMKILLIRNAKLMFCQTIFRVCFATETASANLEGESVIWTTSALHDYIVHHGNVGSRPSEGGCTQLQKQSGYLYQVLHGRCAHG